METSPRFGNSWAEYRNSAEGRWGGIWWGYQVVGRFENEEEIRNYPINIDGQNNRTLLPGDFIYKDVNEDGVINWMDERPIGYPDRWSPMNDRNELEEYRSYHRPCGSYHAILVSEL